MSESNQQAEQAITTVQRNFVIPGCSVTIVCEEEQGIALEQLLGIVFNLSASNPGAKVDFWIKVIG